jgi:hypothetical protein
VCARAIAMAIAIARQAGSLILDDAPNPKQTLTTPVERTN